MNTADRDYTPNYPEDFNVPDLKQDDLDTSVLQKLSKIVLAGLTAAVTAEFLSFRKKK